MSLSFINQIDNVTVILIFHDASNMIEERNIFHNPKKGFLRTRKN